jgi:hypothetical protein
MLNRWMAAGGWGLRVRSRKLVRSREVGEVTCGGSRKPCNPERCSCAARRRKAYILARREFPLLLRYDQVDAVRLTSVRFPSPLVQLRCLMAPAVVNVNACSLILFHIRGGL